MHSKKIIKIAYISALLLILTTLPVISVPNFSINTIDTTIELAKSVFAIDVDSDGDIDILSASYEDDKISWFENNGNEVFQKHYVDTFCDAAQSVYAIDIDSDSDIDVVSASNDDGIFWYENNGNESFICHDINTSLNGATSVFATDFEPDGDIDVFSVSCSPDNSIDWYENDGNQLFTTRNIDKSGSAMYWKSIFVIQIDSIGSKDVLCAGFSTGDITKGRLVWYESGSLLHTINLSVYAGGGLRAIDLDKDGDIDVISQSSNRDMLAWYENDGNESFTPHDLPDTAENFNHNSVCAVDIDLDGDNDIFTCGVIWFENNGSETFSPHTISGGMTDICATDIDSDGDVDFIGCSPYGIIWFENDLSPKIITPNGGESIDSGNVYSINWESSFSGNVKIEYSVNKGLEWIIIDTSTENDGSYNWNVPSVTSDECLVRISATSSLFDESDSLFSIVGSTKIQKQINNIDYLTKGITFPKNIAVEIYDIKGRIVFSTKHATSFMVNEFLKRRNGIYLMKWENNKSVVVNKILLFKR